MHDMRLKTIGLWYLVLASTVRADESFHFLRVKDGVYTNVTVTTITPTDIYFTHAQGLASAKLKDLDPELQKHFHFDPAKSARIEQADIQATTDFQAKLAQQKPVSTPKPSLQNHPDPVVSKIYARSIRGQPAPQLQVEKWLTDQPDTFQKFILIDFWTTWSEPCRQAIPHLNDLLKESSGRLVIIGLTDETEEVVHAVMSPPIGVTPPDIQYSLAIDTQGRMGRALEITALPHCILIDPSGVVRFEGNPLYLSEDILNHYLDKYSE